MTTHDLFLEFLAAVPVGHEVVIEYLARRRGKKVEVDARFPFVVDVTTGIRYGSGSISPHPANVARGFEPDPDLFVAERYAAVVRGCEVMSTMGSQVDSVWTHLVVEIRKHLPADEAGG